MLSTPRGLRVRVHVVGVPPAHAARKQRIADRTAPSRTPPRVAAVTHSVGGFQKQKHKETRSLSSRCLATGREARGVMSHGHGHGHAMHGQLRAAAHQAYILCRPREMTLAPRARARIRRYVWRSTSYSTPLRIRGTVLQPGRRDGGSQLQASCRQGGCNCDGRVRTTGLWLYILLIKNYSKKQPLLRALPCATTSPSWVAQAMS